MQTIETLEDEIKTHPFLEGINPHFHHFFADCATLLRVNRDRQIFREGGDADHFYLIRSGKVILETFVPGCGMVTIQTLNAGEPLGWSWLFPPHEWHFSATAGEPTELIAFEAASLREKAEENRDFSNELVTRVAKILLERLQATRIQLIDLYGMRP